MKSSRPDRAKSSAQPTASAAAAVAAPSVEPLTGSAWERFVQWLGLPVDGASLALFRIAVGIVMLLEAWSLFQPLASSAGRPPMEVYYTDPAIHFHLPYTGFGWLPWLPPVGMKAVGWLLGIGALMMALGWFYRAAAATVFLTWGYFYAVESTRTYWMSYYYLELLITFLMIWLPAARRFSVDAVRTKPGAGEAGKSVPAWTVWLLRGQIVLCYFYAGVAKLNPDWLKDAQPVRYFLSQVHSTEVFGSLLNRPQHAALDKFLHNPDFAHFLSVTGALFDLSVGFLLLGRRTRLLGLVLAAMFHGVNHFVLFKDIVWFPLLGVLTVSIFLEPDWPLRVVNWCKRPHFSKPQWPWFCVGGIVVPVVGAALGWKAQPADTVGKPLTLPRFVPVLLVAWLTVQVLIPVRHYLIEGDARITFEGLPFSWRLKAEVYRSTPCEITLDDPALVTRETDGTRKIHWGAWKGDRVLYHQVNPKTIDWTTLPELVVLAEPMLGERVIYNPLAGPAAPRDLATARTRAAQLWQATFGHAPTGMQPLLPVSDVMLYCGIKLKEAGLGIRNPEDAQAVLSLLRQFNETGRDHGLMPVVRRMHPYALEGGKNPGGAFLVLEDPALMREVERREQRMDRAQWKAGEGMRSAVTSRIVHEGGEPLELFTTQNLSTAGDKLPRALLADRMDDPASGPRVLWNYLADMPPSKAMHVGLQPFLLRRYAQRVASIWEAEQGRRPAVRAVTHVSLNGRPVQAVVDPTVDLAKAGVRWFGHNAWVRDLELPRIPADGSLN